MKRTLDSTVTMRTTGKLHRVDWDSRRDVDWKGCEHWIKTRCGVTIHAWDARSSSTAKRKCRRCHRG
jgi:hypothetical protein